MNTIPSLPSPSSFSPSPIKHLLLPSPPHPLRLNKCSRLACFRLPRVQLFIIQTTTTRHSCCACRDPTSHLSDHHRETLLITRVLDLLSFLPLVFPDQFTFSDQSIF